MFRIKGWSKLYDKMNSAEVRTELRRIERATYVHDKESKIAYLAKLPRVCLSAAQIQELMAARPGGITMVRYPLG